MLHASELPEPAGIAATLTAATTAALSGRDMRPFTTSWKSPSPETQTMASTEEGSSSAALSWASPARDVVTTSS
eukprot:scaffold289799_cov28-Tisochrysis_lutea.AAC.1